MSNFSTANLTNMSAMFQSCEGLKKLNLRKMRTEKVTMMDSMFMGCTGLKELDLSKFSIKRVLSMKWMFGYCKKLKKVRLGKWKYNKKLSKELKPVFATTMYDKKHGYKKLAKGKIIPQGKGFIYVDKKTAKKAKKAKKVE